MNNQTINFKINIKQIIKYIENRTDFKGLDNKNPEYKDSVLLFDGGNDGTPICRFRLIIDFNIKNIEFYDLSDTTLYMAGLQTKTSFNILNFKQEIDEFITNYLENYQMDINKKVQK